MRISVVGLGKLGSPMVACFAAKGFTTIGVGDCLFLTVPAGSNSVLTPTGVGAGTYSFALGFRNVSFTGATVT